MNSSDTTGPVAIIRCYYCDREIDITEQLRKERERILEILHQEATIGVELNFVSRAERILKGEDNEH